METLLHMHDGEPVYYTGSCYVCDSETATEIESPEPEEYDEPEYVTPYREIRREITLWHVREVIRTFAFLGVLCLIWLISFWMLLLIMHGVK